MRLDLLFTYRFAVRLHERFNDGWTSTAALYEELQPLGYRGSYRSVRDYVRPLRSDDRRETAVSLAPNPIR